MTARARLAAATVLAVAVLVGGYAAWRGAGQPDGAGTGVLPGPSSAAEESGTATAPSVPAVDAPPRPRAIPPGVRPPFPHGRLQAETDAEGRPAGVRVHSVMAGGKLARLGVRVGDLIVAVNARRLDNPEMFERAVEVAEDRIRSATNLNLTVRRGGEVFTLTALRPVPAPADEAPR